MTASNPEESLAKTLLADPPVVDERRFAYPWYGMLIATLFVAYHVTILLVWNTPSTNLGKPLHRFFNEHFYMQKYMRATGNSQSWAMFAPNPHRSNMFMKVLVVDDAGEVWDLAHDIYRRRTYPYVFYDRMGKINRRIIEQEGYRRHYAAWVCREWERTHGGEPAEEIRFVKMWTRIPEPHKVIGAAGWNLGAMWYDPDLLPLHQTEEDTIRCNMTRQAQLPEVLRERYGLPPTDRKFRGLRPNTWYNKVKSQKTAEEQPEERDAPSADEGGQ